jgi:hypothetical protein
MDMYYIEPFFHHWVIKNSYDENFLFGPFESEADAHFVAQMFRANKIIFNKGEEYGEEGTEKSHSVY